MEQLNDTPDFIIFLGRFHPLLVHLPIGILFLGIITHFLSKKKSFNYLQKTVPFILAIGTICAIITCILGYLLSYQGGYNNDALFNHQWLGIAVTCISALAYTCSMWKKTKKNSFVNSLMMISILIGLGFTGHLGGNLTHGSTYLTQYAPAPIRTVMGLPPKQKERPPITVLDSADIFLDVIQPLIANKCISCHNTEKLKGGLLLTSYKDMLLGGENGAAIVAKDLEKSELFKRITLPKYHKDFMPPEGKKPFSEDNIKLIEFWILNGAKPNGLLADVKLTNKQTNIFNTFLGIKSTNNSFNSIVETADSTIVNTLHLKGFKIKKISTTSNLLEVSIQHGNKTAINHIKDLLTLKNQIAKLNLSKSNLQDNDLKTIGQLKLLVNLKIHSNPISSIGISHLTKLENLESLNIYNTNADNKSLQDISQLKKLKRLYIWNTNITQEKIEEFKSNTNLNIVAGVKTD